MSAGGSTRTALRALVSPATRTVLIVGTVLIGLGAAFAVAFSMPPDARTYPGIASPTQLILSVLTPFAAILLTFDLRAEEGGVPARTVEALRGRWVVATGYGVVIGLYGAIIAAAATAMIAESRPTADPWAGFLPAALGSLVVQLIPVGVGCAAGLLVPRVGLADLATIVVPLGVTVILGALAPSGARDWVTPLGAAGHLVPGPMTAITWAQWIVTAALWVVLPNWVGARLLRRRAALLPDS